MVPHVSGVPEEIWAAHSLHPSVGDAQRWFWAPSPGSLSAILGMIPPQGVDLAFIYSSPEDFTDSPFLQALSISDLFGRSITKRTQNAGSAVRKGVIWGTDPEQNLSVFFGSPLDTVLKVVFRLLDSDQHISISILRSAVAHNCSQVQPSMMVVLAVAILNRKARTERNMGNGEGMERKTDKMLSGKCLSLWDLNTKCCGLLLFWHSAFCNNQLVLFYQIGPLLEMFEHSQTFCKHRYF